MTNNTKTPEQITREETTPGIRADRLAAARAALFALNSKLGIMAEKRPDARDYTPDEYDLFRVASAAEDALRGLIDVLEAAEAPDRLTQQRLLQLLGVEHFTGAHPHPALVLTPKQLEQLGDGELGPLIFIPEQYIPQVDH